MFKTIDRLVLFIKDLGLSARQFDMSIGTANGYTLRMHKNNASVGSDVIEKIIRTYPQINLVWLITGKGDMLVSKETKHNKKDVDLGALEKLIEQKIETKLTEDNSELVQRLLEEINKEIELTKKRIDN